MCRHLAYLGPPIPLTDLVVSAPHSLLRQSTDAREQSSGRENPDGWGYGFEDETSGTVHRYRTSVPMPQDPSGMAGLARVRSGCFLAHVRHRSPGAPVQEAGNAPFLDGHWLFAHNGYIAEFRESHDSTLRERLSPSRRARVEGEADSEVLFGLVLDRVDSGADPLEAMAETIADLSGPRGDDGRFNLLLTDGHRLIASRWGNSLHMLVEERGTERSVIISSEPLDRRAGWSAVPDRTFVDVDSSGVSLIPYPPE